MCFPTFWDCFPRIFSEIYGIDFDAHKFECNFRNAIRLNFRWYIHIPSDLIVQLFIRKIFQGRECDFESFCFQQLAEEWKFPVLGESIDLDSRYSRMNYEE